MQKNDRLKIPRDSNLELYRMAVSLSKKNNGNGLCLYLYHFQL